MYVCGMLSIPLIYGIVCIFCVFGMCICVCYVYVVLGFKRWFWDLGVRVWASSLRLSVISITVEVGVRV